MLQLRTFGGATLLADSGPLGGAAAQRTATRRRHQAREASAIQGTQTKAAFCVQTCTCWPFFRIVCGSPPRMPNTPAVVHYELVPGHHVEVKLAATNLLGAKREFTQGSEIQRQFDPGRKVSLSLSYTPF